MALQLTGTDSSGSPHLSLSGGVTQTFAYSPFGATTARTGAAASLPGFNGERADPLNGLTHLGNGYRAYSPALRRFTCPDSESPFGAGGINPYVYCDSDPINQADPSGHGPIMWLIEGTCWIARRAGRELRVAESVASAVATTEKVITGVSAAANFATGIASAATGNSNPQASDKLLWASVGLGITTAAFVAPEQISRISKHFKRTPGRAVSEVSEHGAATRGWRLLSGRASERSPVGENVTALGNDFYVHHSGTRESHSNRLIITAHGARVPRGKVRVPTGSEIRYYGKDGASLNDPGMSLVLLDAYDPSEIIKGGEYTQNYFLGKYRADSYERINYSQSHYPGFDILTVRSGASLFTSLRDVLNALNAAGLKYDHIDAAYCRTSIIDVLLHREETVFATQRPRKN